MWKIRHRVVRTAHFLTSHMRFRFSPNCQRCRPRAVCETQKHVFISCPFARAVWRWILPIASSIYGSPLERNEATLFLDNGLSRSKGDRTKTNLVTYLIKLACWFLWDTRNRFVFENKASSSAEVLSQIKRTISDRIRGEASLHPEGSIAVGRRWGVNDVLCSVRGDGSLSINI